MHCFDSISANWMESFEKTKIFYQNKFKYSKMKTVFNYIMLTISAFIHKTIYMHLSSIKTGSLSRSNSNFMFWCALCGFFWLDTMPLLKRALNRAYQAKFNEKMQSNTSIFFQSKVLISANIKFNYHFHLLKNEIFLKRVNENMNFILNEIVFDDLSSSSSFSLFFDFSILIDSRLLIKSDVSLHNFGFAAKMI